MLPEVVIVVRFFFELSGSNPVNSKVRFQTLSSTTFGRGVEYFRRDNLLDRAGMVSRLE